MSIGIKIRSTRKYLGSIRSDQEFMRGHSEWLKSALSVVSSAPSPKLLRALAPSGRNSMAAACSGGRHAEDMLSSTLPPPQWPWGPRNKISIRRRRWHSPRNHSPGCLPLGGLVRTPRRTPTWIPTVRSGYRKLLDVPSCLTQVSHANR